MVAPLKLIAFQSMLIKLNWVWRVGNEKTRPEQIKKVSVNDITVVTCGQKPY